VRYLNFVDPDTTFQNGVESALVFHFDANPDQNLTVYFVVL
jgi:hypothetical protein